METYNLLLIDSLNRGIIPYQSDISKAFQTQELNMKPGEELFIRFNGKIYKLNKAIYGLKQAGIIFFNKLSKLLIDEHFEQSVNDPCLYRRVESDGFISRVGVLTDDLIYAMREYERNLLVTNLRKQLDIPTVEIITNKI